MTIFRTFLLSLQFLTIIPVKVKGNITEKDLAGATPFFPVAGTIPGLLIACFACLLCTVFSPDLTAALVLATYVLISGGFHLDGLADTFDALSVKSTGNKDLDIEKRLVVMRDSHVGAIGVIALCLTLLVKYICLKEMFSVKPPHLGYRLLFLMPVLSAWSMVAAMYRERSAQADGLGKIFIDHMTLGKLSCASIFTVIICLFPLLSLDRSSFPIIMTQGALPLILFCAFILTCLASAILARLFARRFGGLTGDILGAIHEITELLFLVVATLVR